MNATIIPFPAARQHGVIRQELLSMAKHDDYAARVWFAGVVRLHKTRLKSLGIDPALIDANSAALEQARKVFANTALQIC
jgi:hypothetical protein